MTIAHWDEVEGERGEVGHLAGVWYDLGEAAGQPLQAPGGPAPSDPAAVLLAEAALPPIVQEAVARREVTGPLAEQAQRQRGIDVQVGDPGGAYLGLASGTTAWPDAAAGWGWFVDPTSWDDGEFTAPGD